MADCSSTQFRCGDNEKYVLLLTLSDDFDVDGLVYLPLNVSSHSVRSSPGVFPYGGSVTVSRTVVMDLMSLRPVLHVTAPSDASSVRMGTVPTRSSCATDTWTAMMDLMKTQHSAVCTPYISCINCVILQNE